MITHYPSVWQTPKGEKINVKTRNSVQKSEPANSKMQRK
jgi:hypothetical protein